MEELKFHQKEKKRHPYKRANVLSKIFFCWLPPFLVKGLKKELDEDNMYITRTSHRSDLLGKRLQDVWQKELAKQKPSLMKALFLVFKLELIISAFFNAFIDLIKIAQPILISQLVSYFQADANVSRNQIYLSSFLLILVSLIQILCIHNYQLLVMTLGMKIRIASCALIYRKSLKLSKSALAETTIGQMVNLLSNDVGRFDFTCQHVHNLWMAPVDTIVVMIMLYFYVGPTGLIGCVFLLSFIPIQMYMAKLTSQYRLKTAIKTDERVRLMNEIISGIQIIKMYTWEKPFAKLVEIVRKLEIDQIRHTSTIRAIMISLNMTMSRTAIFLCVLTYVVSGNTLTASYAFTVSSFYGFLRLTVTQLFPQAIIQFAETRVSILRIQQFLLYEELTPEKCIGTEINGINEKVDIEQNGIYKPISFECDLEKKPMLDDSLIIGYEEKAKSEIILTDIHEEHSGGENDSNGEHSGGENDCNGDAQDLTNKDNLENVNNIDNLDDLPIKVTKEVGFKLKHVSVKWIKSLPENTLEDICFQAKSNQLVAVVGPVGGGKSTLLHVILRELLPLTGTVKINGTVSYASQEPWLFGGSIRQNILFGQEYDDDRYEQVIRVCALDRDFALLPHADRTLVGERGVTLSGGQRARVNLARAIYKESDIYLLDDPLSAVDTHVGKQLFKKCITRYLRNKCVVLVTHQLQYLRKANWIYVLEDGRVRASGTYQNLTKSDSAFIKLLETSKEEEKRDEPRKMSRTESVHSELGEYGFEEVIELQKEERATGTISLDVYKAYFTAGGHWIKIIILILAFIAAQLFGSMGDIFLTTWVNVEQFRTNPPGLEEGSIKNTTNLTSSDNVDIETTFWSKTLTDQTALVIYSILVISTVVLSVSRSIVFFRYCLTASTRLHNTMFGKIVYSPMLFFNTNPSGRILNRFSKDIGALDETLPMCIVDTLGIGLIVTGTTLVIALVNPWILLPTAVILVIFYFIRTLFLASSRNIKRVEAITRSPIYTHLAASLQGLTTIRSSKAEEILIREFDHFQDDYTAAFWMFLTANRGFGFWLDLHCIIFIALVIISILFVESESLGGNVGLSLTQAVTLSGMFQWGMRQWSELENQMTSVERVQEYANLPEEIDEAKNDPPDNWPSAGHIRFKNMSLTYSDADEYVLKSLNFEIQPREKIGIVGRTGAGKSSLIQALFRLTHIDGSIIIDNINSKSVPLRTLRSKISIIPQEPVLFSGTLRKNLDPFDEYSDDILWSALEEVELKHAVHELPDGLYGKMAESGSNFSVGQRQLVCLARAIVRNNKILVLDEATANVDPMTDAIIQTTIREKFADCTVLTIAHRLNTIMDSDKVLVMDAGEAVEFDHPHTLLEKKGVFYSLVKQCGSAMAANLKAIAEESFAKCLQQSRIDNSSNDLKTIS